MFDITNSIGLKKPDTQELIGTGGFCSGRVVSRFVFRRKNYGMVRITFQHWQEKTKVVVRSTFYSIQSLYEMREISNSNLQEILREYQATFSGSRRVKIVKVDHNEEL